MAKILQFPMARARRPRARCNAGPRRVPAGADMAMPKAMPEATPDRRRLPQQLRPRMNDEHSLRDLDNIADARLRALEEKEEKEKKVKAAATARSQPDGGGKQQDNVHAPRRELRAAIARLAKCCGWKAHAGMALGPAIVEAAGKERALLEGARALLNDARRGIGVPDTFHGALKFEFSLVGRSPRWFSKVTGIPGQVLANYAEGRKVPRVNRKAQFAALEDHLRLPRGHIWDCRVAVRESRQCIDASDLPRDLADTRYKADKLRRFLPEDYSCLPAAAKAAWIKKYRTHLRKRAATDAGKIALQRRDNYRLKEVPARLAREMDRYFEFRRPKRLLFGDISRKDGLNTASANKWRHRFRLYFGFLANRLHELEWIAHYAPFGPFSCVRPKDLCLAMLVVPALVAAYGRWLIDRKTRFKRKGSTTLDEVELLKEIERMTRPPAVPPPANAIRSAKRRRNTKGK